MRAEDQEVGPAGRGAPSPAPGTRLPRQAAAPGRVAGLTALAALALAGAAAAEPYAPTIPPDPPERRAPPRVGPGDLPPSWDLDGTYLWLGPTGAAGRADGVWDSAVGGQAAVLVVRERAGLAAVGGAAGASLWTERGGGRIWLDAVAGTYVGGRMVGLTAGPVLELAATQHPRVGGTVGVWAFFGVTPYVRVGGIAELGAFAEVGIHLMLPVFRR